eukprot:COSAG05_NODE_1022_length_6130_cov_48.450174_8_plen_72_part_00
MRVIIPLDSGVAADASPHIHTARITCARTYRTHAGAHTEAVLREEVGLTTAQIDKLRRSGVFGAPPPPPDG